MEVNGRRTLWNDGWEHRRRVSVFQELGGAAGSWEAVALPHDALIRTDRDATAPGGDTNGFHRGGAFEYRKSFSVPAEDAGRRISVEFDGVYRDAAVFVNGALAGQWTYGYSRFSVRIDPFVKFGADNEIRVECRTHLDSRWYAGAGIHRDVHLLSLPEVHIAPDGVTVTTPEMDDEYALVAVEVTVVNGSLTTRTPRAAVTLRDERGEIVGQAAAPVTLRPGEAGEQLIRIPLERPERWSVDRPYIYTAEAVLTDGDDEVDRDRQTFGIREVRVDSRRGLRINGEPTLLRGACIHGDNGPLGAVSMYGAEERRVRLLKEAGFNAIRMSHHPASPALLEACDRLGMLVMDETFDMWTSGKTDFDASVNFLEWWERDVAAMVAKDRNHPSVIMYSIGNEVPELGIPEGGRWSRLLANKVRELDPTRLVTNGVNGFVAAIDMVIAGMAQRRSQIDDAQQGAGVNGMMTQIADQMNMISAAPPVTARTEEAFAALDVAGMNYGDGRYELDASAFPNRVIVGSETFPTRIAHNWALVERLDNVIGDFTWTGWDYLGEVGLGGVGYLQEGQSATASVAKAFPWLLASTGDIDITGCRRPVSFYREIAFGLRSEPFLAVQDPAHHGQQQLRTPWAWSDAVASWSWNGHEGQPVTVEVYADADEVEVLVAGESVGRAVVGADFPLLATLEVIYRPGAVEAVAYRNGRETGRTRLESAGEGIVLRAAAERETVRTDGTDLVYVPIVLEDAQGIRHLSEDRRIDVGVAGAGELLALGTARPEPTENFTRSHITTHAGRALAIVRPTGPGEITVTVAAEGLDAATVRITAD